MRFCLPLLCLLLALLGSASAHPQFALSTVNRYGRMVLLPGRVLLDYSLMVGEVPAERLKREADLDGNGTLSEAEQKQMTTALAATIDREVTVQLDGNSVPLGFVMQPLVLKSPKVEAVPFALELSAVLTIQGSTGPHTLVFDDRADIPPVGEVEFRVEEGPGIELTSTQSGAAKPTGPAAPKGTESTKLPMLFRQFGPPRSMLSDRSVQLRFQDRKQVLGPAFHAWPGTWTATWTYGLGIAALLALCGLGIFARRFLRS